LSCSIDLIVPEMTIISKPNRKPPRAAIMLMST
jgi:hypothetical protein